MNRRDEREQELRAIYAQPNGPEKLRTIYLRLHGLPPGRVVPSGIPIYQAILEKEYPTQSTAEV